MKINYTQNEVTHEVTSDTQQFGMSVLWDIAMNMEDDTRKEIMINIHGILGAVLYGEIIKGE